MFIKRASNKKKYISLAYKRFSPAGRVAYKQAIKCNKLLYKHHARIKSRLIHDGSHEAVFKNVNKKMNGCQ